jgi:hypothetical protein
VRSSANSFNWCGDGNALIDSKLWLDKEPSNTNGSENCAQLVVNKTSSTARLDDRHCGRLTAFACQVKKFISTSSINIFYIYFPV